MAASKELALISRRYREAFGAVLRPSFQDYRSAEREDRASAALGYRWANAGLLFLECYLDQPIETLVGAVLDRTVQRRQIVEIGNFAADNAIAMVELWGAVANDLAGDGEVAVATLTAPMRKMFRRLGVPIHELASARPDSATINAADWGCYYDADPIVCCGLIAPGQEAIARFLARRGRSAAA